MSPVKEKTVSKSSGHKNITRIDQESKSLHGWYVRIGWHGKVHAKWFPDHEDKAGALDEAIDWRNKIESDIGKPRTERWIRSPNPGNRPGVSRRIKDGTPVYEVTWMPSPGKIQKTSYSILAHGEDEARTMAIELRKQKEREYYGGELT